MIYSGTLTERLDFYHLVETQSASGYKSTARVKYMSVLADRLKNKETYVVDANEVFHLNELTFKLRYRSGILDTDEVVYQGQRYRITSVDRQGRENEITIILSKIND